MDTINTASMYIYIYVSACVCVCVCVCVILFFVNLPIYYKVSKN